MFDEHSNIATEITLPPSLDAIDDVDIRPGRVVDNILIRPEGIGNVCISWTSDDETAMSWIFLNGKLVVGPFMAGTKERSIVLPVPTDKTFKIEVHDYYGTTPHSSEELPQTRPIITWDAVGSAFGYKIYHTIFDIGQRAVASQSAPGYAVASESSITSLLAQVPPISTERIEIDCPTKLEGRGGRWHHFRVESVDQFGNESENHRLAFFATDFPKPPQLLITRNTETGLFNFRVEH